MSDKTHKILTTLLGMVFTVCVVLTQSSIAAAHPKFHEGLDLAIAILGALGITAAKPLIGDSGAAK